MPQPGRPYPVNLDLAGRRCLVVGAGRVAARKAAGLVASGARVHVVAVEVGPEVAADDSLTWEERPYRRGEVAGYWLVLTATDDPEVNRQVRRDGDEAGVWVNSADDPGNCSFTLPAVMWRDPLMVAVSTGGASPAVAAWLAEQLEAELGPEYTALIDVLSREREEIRAAGGSTEGLDWRRALDSGMLELIREGRLAEAKERLKACLSSQSD